MITLRMYVKYIVNFSNNLYLNALKLIENNLRIEITHHLMIGFHMKRLLEKITTSLGFFLY